MPRFSLIFLAIVFLASCASKPAVRLSPADELEALIASKAEPPPAKSASGNAAPVVFALSLLDRRYQYGGNNPEQGFDCSGFMKYVFKQSAGLDLPRTAAEQAGRGKALTMTDLQPGDAVFFNTLGRAYSHVGLYLGDGKFIHAPRSGAAIRVEKINLAYWQTRFEGGRRF